MSYRLKIQIRMMQWHLARLWSCDPTNCTTREPAFSLSFLPSFLLCVWVSCLQIDLFIRCMAGAKGSQKGASEPLELQLQTGGSATQGAGSNLGHLEEKLGVLNHGLISLAPDPPFRFICLSLFVCFVFLRYISLGSSGYSEARGVDQAGIKFTEIFPPLLPKCWY